jgi:hypothetical protein
VSYLLLSTVRHHVISPLSISPIPIVERHCRVSHHVRYACSAQDSSFFIPSHSFSLSLFLFLSLFLLYICIYTHPSKTHFENRYTYIIYYIYIFSPFSLFSSSPSLSISVHLISLSLFLYISVYLYESESVLYCLTIRIGLKVFSVYLFLLADISFFDIYV